MRHANHPHPANVRKSHVGSTFAVAYTDVSCERMRAYVRASASPTFTTLGPILSPLPSRYNGTTITAPAAARMSHAVQPVRTIGAVSAQWAWSGWKIPSGAHRAVCLTPRQPPKAGQRNGIAVRTHRARTPVCRFCWCELMFTSYISWAGSGVLLGFVVRYTAFVEVVCQRRHQHDHLSEPEDGLRSGHVAVR